MDVALEDNWEDVVGKAATGLAKDAAALAAETGADRQKIAALLGARLDEETLLKIAPALHLDPDSLLALARGGYHPNVDAPEGLLVFNFAFPAGGYSEMRVNAFVVHAPGESRALVFDSGGHPDEIAAALRENNLTAAALFLTHTHQDHTAGIDTLQTHTGAPLHAPRNELYPGAKPVADGDRLAFGSLTVTARETAGHSPGGTTFVIEGAGAPVAIVGDALFAGSAGGAPSAWTAALDRVREKIFSLPDETLLCPGHGPITTVAQEKAHNPLFPELKSG